MKLLFKIMLVLILTPLWSFGTDIQGQDNTVILGDYITGVFDEVAGFVTLTNAHQVVDSARVIRNINKARKNCANKYEFRAIQRDTTIVVVAGTESYALPSDFNRVKWVAAISKNTGVEVSMIPGKEDAFGKNRPTSGLPKKYLVYKRNIIITPAINANDSVVVHYLANSNTLSIAADTCNIDKEYEEYVILTASKSILRGMKIGSIEYDNKTLEELATAIKKEEERLIRASKSVFETVTQ